MGKLKKAARASAEAGKSKKGAHAELSLTGLERMAASHRKFAGIWREKSKAAASQLEQICFRTAEEVHNESAVVLQLEADELRKHA